MSLGAKRLNKLTQTELMMPTDLSVDNTGQRKRKEGVKLATSTDVKADTVFVISTS
jgi:hypothetical protein